MTASAGDVRSPAPASMRKGSRASMVALASPCRGILLDWTLVSSESSMLMLTNVEASPAGLPREKRAPTPIITSADCITSKSWFISCLSPRGLKQEP